MLVRSPDQLLRLARDSGANGFGPRPRIVIDIEGLPRHAQLRAQQLLDRLQSRCGCVAGGIATLLSLVAGLVWMFERGAPAISLGTAGHLLAVLALSFIAGLIAKLATLAVTRIQFARQCRLHHASFCRLLAAG
jgi:hypothetical protein